MITPEIDTLRKNQFGMGPEVSSYNHPESNNHHNDHEKHILIGGNTSNSQNTSVDIGPSSSQQSVNEFNPSYDIQQLKKSIINSRQQSMKKILDTKMLDSKIDES